MGPQNTDPNNPNPSSSPAQPDLSSIMGSTTTPQPDPALTPVVPTMNPVPMDVTPTPTPVPPPPEPPTPAPPSVMEPPPSLSMNQTPIPNPVLSPETNPEPISPPPQPQPIPDPTPEPSAFSWSENGGLASANQSPTPTPADPNPFDPFSAPQTDSAPTDLSQLTGVNPEPQNVYTPPVSQPETLVVSPSAPDTIQAESSEKKSIPKWIWIVGGIVILLVIGASAYFILGIGQAPKEASIPVTQQPALVTPPQPTPATQVPTPDTSTSAGFSGVGGGSQQSTATTAAEILKQKLQK